VEKKALQDFISQLCGEKGTPGFHLAAVWRKRHSRISFRSCVEKKGFLHNCKIKSGSALGTRLTYKLLFTLIY